MEKFSANLVSSTVNKLEKTILNNYISNVITLSDKDFLLVFSFLKKQKLFISLNHECPLLGLVDSDLNITSIANKLRDILRKEIKDAKIIAINQINNDRIIDITLEKTQDVIFKETKHLIMEFIPHKPNLIITDDNFLIKYAIHQSSMDSNRIILPGIKYEPLTNKNFIYISQDAVLDNFQETINNFLLIAIENKSKEKYKNLYKILKLKIKSITKKLTVLNNEIEISKSNLSLADTANGLLSLANDKNELEKYIEINNIDYDKNLSVGANANKLFLRYKKYKRTIEMDNLQIEKANQLISEYQNDINLLPYMSDNELIQLDLKLNPQNYKKVHIKSYNSISFIEYKKSKIYYGKNANQNNFLTFKLANKEDTFLHIKDYHGSHVIIKGNVLDNDVLLFASEICLLLANKNNGDILYTPVKNVKKGKELGNVNLLSYKEITLHNVRESTKKELIINSKEYRY